MRVVINQPCYLPWRGYFALIKAADVFVFYDDVQLPYGRGSSRGFQTRIQLKTQHGKKWLSVPVKRDKRHAQTISDAQIQEESKWRKQHYALLKDSFSKTPYWRNYDSGVSAWYNHDWDNLADLTINTTLDIARILGIKKTFLRSSELGIAGNKTERLVRICTELGATEYISPWGSIDYLKHELFEDAGIKVNYINYDNSPYPQEFGDFDPFVTVLDLLANTGSAANAHIRVGVIPWRDMAAMKLQKVAE